MGWKQWTRERLTAADLQALIQDQTVMRFSSSAQRTAQLPAPAEGMVSTLDDTDAVDRHDGSGWRPLPHGYCSGKAWATTGSAVLAVGAESVVDMGASRVSGGFVFTASDDTLTVPYDGLYDLTSSLYLTGAGTGLVGQFIRRQRASVANLLINQPGAYKPFAGNDVISHGAQRDLPLKAGDKLCLVAYAYHTGMGWLGASEVNGSMLHVTYKRPLNGATPV